MRDEKDIVIKGSASFNKFAELCAERLFAREPYHFIYPENCSLKNWEAEKIKNLNKDFLIALRNKGNIYSIFIRNRGDKWERIYVGERKSKGLRERITQHLIAKDVRTGSMLEKVKQAVAEGKEIGVSFIKVEPESLRLFVEEMIIIKYGSKLRWNTHG